MLFGIDFEDPKDRSWLTWLIEEAEKGDSHAQFMLGSFYYEGKGVQLDYKQAFDWWCKAAEQGDAQAQYNLGICYLEGTGVHQDDNQVVVWWQQAAQQGHVQAQYGLGVFYREGRGVNQDDKLASSWLEQAAQQGHVQAQHNLGVLYYGGRGVHQDEKQAAYWWQKAAKQGNICARFQLVNLYNIEGKEQECDDWLRESATSLIDLENIEKEHYFKDTPCSAIIIEFLEVKQENPVVQVILGQLYKTGYGITQNRQKAYMLFQQAAEQGDLLAQYCLGIAYLKGQGVTLNIDKARQQFQKIMDSLKQDKIFYYPEFSIDNILKTKQQQYSKEVKRWLALMVKDKLNLIAEKVAQEELEDMIAMIAHQFRGGLQNIEYHITYDNAKKRALESVHSMQATIKILGMISTEAQRLQEQLTQDKQGESTLLTVLENALLYALSQLLMINNSDKISQHYWTYARKTGQIPANVSRAEWQTEYFELEAQLQMKWEKQFIQLLERPNLSKIINWIEEHFFSIDIKGFEESSVTFKRYGSKESMLTIIITEMLLNAIKYYSAFEEEKYVELQWHCDDKFCQLLCKNPSRQEEWRKTKGSGKGQKILNIIAKKIAGEFPKPNFQEHYVARFKLPQYLIAEKCDEPIVVD